MDKYITITEQQREQAESMAEIWNKYAEKILNSKSLSKKDKADYALAKAMDILSALSYFAHNKADEEQYDIIINAVADCEYYKKHKKLKLIRRK